MGLPSKFDVEFTYNGTTYVISQEAVGHIVWIEKTDIYLFTTPTGKGSVSVRRVADPSSIRSDVFQAHRKS